MGLAFPKKVCFPLKCSSYRAQHFFSNAVSLPELAPRVQGMLLSHVCTLSPLEPAACLPSTNAPLKSLGRSKRSRIWSRKRLLLWHTVVMPKQKQGRQEALCSR